jgi:hypothetical protein
VLSASHNKVDAKRGNGYTLRRKGANKCRLKSEILKTQRCEISTHSRSRLKKLNKEVKKVKQEVKKKANK